MPEFQMFVSCESSIDLDPCSSRYVCVKQLAEQADDCERNASQISTLQFAEKNATAPFVGISTAHCLLDIAQVSDERNGALEFAELSKVETLDLPALESLGYIDTGSITLPQDISIVLPKPTSWLDSDYMTGTFRHVMWYWWHRRDRDFDTLAKILSDISPEFLEDLDAYRNDSIGFPLGTFLMREDIFKEYSGWALAVTRSYTHALALSDDVSWVESLAPDIVARHLLAIYAKHLQRTCNSGRTAYASCTYYEHMESPYLAPAFDSNNIAVVLASDAAYAPLMSVTIESILQNSSPCNNYDLIVLEAGLTNADFEFLSQQTSSYPNVAIRFLHLGQYLEKKELPTLAHISTTTFARFLILDYLTNYSKAVYLDTDLVCNTDIAELYETDVSDYLIAAVRDTADAGWSNIVDNDTRQYIDDVIQLDNVYDYFNAGVLVLNVEALAQVTSCEKLMRTSLEKEWRWMDQDVLNHLCAGRVKYLDQSWNYMAHKESYFTPETTPEVWLPTWLQNAYREAHHNPRIVHYAGHATPCFSLYSDSAWLFWKYARTSPYYETLVSMASAEMPSDPLNPIARARAKKKLGPLVSIIVPVYNSAPYLRKALDSLLRQTYKNLEVICVNDGSKDDSLSILEEYARQDSRITVVNKENSGAGATRNVGMGHVRGKYLCFFDSDDFLVQNAIEDLVRIAEKNQADAVVFNMDQYDDKTGVFSPNTWAVSRDHITPGKVFYAADINNFYKRLVGFTVNKLYRSSFLLGLDLRFPQIGAHEDMPFTYIALSASKRTYYYDETLYHYRRAREGSLSDSTNDRYIYMFDALDCLKEGLIKRGLWADYQRAFVNYVLHMCIWKHSELDKFMRLEFRDSCRKTWFEHFGILGPGKDFFYDPEDYGFVEDTVNMSFTRRLAAECYRRRLPKEE
ncbi:glycosyltransferase [Adlercreutzia sp. ZJ473]|uniref:glycosyltransferase n=1 Tax=Adlercreutzia sp. ZJ473 TaxID=2722822 RepID=UPI0015536E24|nr:glycosyltransferase [Adlercreutzia sp. ZJ473]